MNRSKSLLRAVAWAAPAVAVYVVLLPLAAVRLDRRFGLAPLPEWSSSPASVFLILGTATVLWTMWLFATVGHGTPNPLAPPRALVAHGPYRCTRNPMMLGAWLVGIGIASILRSPSLLVLLVLVIAAGVIYVRLIEEPRLRQRFGRAYVQYERDVSRWLRLSRGCPRMR